MQSRSVRNRWPAGLTTPEAKQKITRMMQAPRQLLSRRAVLGFACLAPFAGHSAQAAERVTFAISSLEAMFFRSAGAVPSRSTFKVSWMARTAAWKGWWPRRLRVPQGGRRARTR